jgi:hypothetical protein
MMITREKLEQILFGRLTTHCTLYDYIPKQMKKVIDDAITEIISELSTAELPVSECELCHGTGRYPVGRSGREDDGNAMEFEDCDCGGKPELPVQGEAVAIADSITLRMLKTWCHTNRFRIEIDLGGVATAGTFGNMRRLWDADLLTMFPALNTRRESDTTPTLKPSVNELVEALTEYVAKDESYIESYQDAEGVGAIPNEESEFFKRYNRAQKALASHQSAKEQV